MKTRHIQIMHCLLGTISMLLATGCGERQASLSQSTAKPTVNAKQDQALKELEAKVGFAFPPNTELVDASDGGGRDQSFGFYAWGIFSPTAIAMPAMKADPVNEILTLKDTLKYVQVMMGNRKNISQPQVAFRSHWETNGYTFRAALVRTPQGDYLAIQQYRKQ